MSEKLPVAACYVASNIENIALVIEDLLDMADEAKDEERKDAIMRRIRFMMSLACREGQNLLDAIYHDGYGDLYHEATA